MAAWATRWIEHYLHRITHLQSVAFTPAHSGRGRALDGPSLYLSIRVRSLYMNKGVGIADQELHDSPLD